MSTQLTAIECPKCGSTQKIEIRPGDFKCQSCGTEYFLDVNSANLTVVSQTGQINAPRSASPIAIIFISTILAMAILIALIGFLMVKSSSNSNTLTKGNKFPDYTWDYSWAGQHLFLSADKRPVLFTLGTKTYGGDQSKSRDFIAFYDLGLEKELKTLPMPGASSMTHEHGSSNFDVREFTNGNMYVLADNLVISRVTKGSLSIEDVTKTLFEKHPEIASGVAKVEFVDNDYDHGNGFKLFTNDGNNFFYFPLRDELCTKEKLEHLRYPLKTLSQGNVEKTGFDFSGGADYDHPEIGAKLISYLYMGDKNTGIAPVPRYSPFKWEFKDELKGEGVLSYKDFTPGRTYFEQGLLYFDDDYVLISLKQTPANNALRYLQCLDARTAAIVFTSRLDELYPPDHCVRYPDGFAMVDAGNTYHVSFTGQIKKYIPDMYKTN